MDAANRLIFTQATGERFENRYVGGQQYARGWDDVGAQADAKLMPVYFLEIRIGANGSKLENLVKDRAKTAGSQVIKQIGRGRGHL